jgi:hypothetical protein
MTLNEHAAISEMDESRNGHVVYARRVFRVDATLAGGAALHHGEDA